MLLEQADRVVYELLDLGFGRCRMVLAGRTRRRRAWASPQRRLGMMRIATKYPRIAERHFEATGRQVEVIEVKGSVELAPLVGLADGIVDLVATGRTLEENDLEVREEIVECTARFVANRVAHKLRAARGRRADREAARGERGDEGAGASSGRAPATTAAAIRALGRRESAPAGRRRRDRARRCCDGGDERRAAR